MKHARLLPGFVLLFWFALAPTAFSGGEPRWKKWPRGAHEMDASIRVPDRFESIPSAIKKSEHMLLNGRFRSPDDAVEFAVAVTYVREAERTIEARKIPLPLAAGEKVTERTPATRKLQSENGDYVLYDEDITVAGPKDAYTRYFRVELSTSSLPGASSCLWEFKVKNEQAQKDYQVAYRQFKKSLDLGEID